MPHLVMFKSSFRSIVKQKSSDVFFLLDESLGRTYRVLPKGFTVHAEPGHPIQLFFGKKEFIL
jgi:hypothetical protein